MPKKENAPSLPETSETPDNSPSTDTPVPGDFGSVSGDSILRAMQGAGSSPEFAGGSLPLLTPDRKGQAWLVKFIGKTLPKDSGRDADKDKGEEKGKFDFLVLEVYDHTKFNPKDSKTWEKASLGKAQMVNSTTMRDIFGEVGAEPKAKAGDIYTIVYNGTGEAKRGFSPPKLFSVYRIVAASEGKKAA